MGQDLLLVEGDLRQMSLPGDTDILHVSTDWFLALDNPALVNENSAVLEEDPVNLADFALVQIPLQLKYARMNPSSFVHYSSSCFLFTGVAKKKPLNRNLEATPNRHEPPAFAERTIDFIYKTQYGYEHRIFDDNTPVVQPIIRGGWAVLLNPE